MKPSTMHILPLIYGCVLLSSVVHSADGGRVKRVIGGEETQEGDWPWLVRLKGRVPHRKLLGIPLAHVNYYCGASILNSRWLVTAAHCFSQPHYIERMRTPKYWHAKFGEVDSTTTIIDWIRGNRDCHLDEIRIHPDYNPDKTWQNDIAVVKLRHSIDIGHDNTDSVALPADDNFLMASGSGWPEAGTRCYFTGWGCSASGASLEEYAREVMLPIVTDETCNEVYGVSTVTRVCAGFERGNAGICPGDSGGPLVCPMPGTNGTELWHYQQAGIASFTSRDSPGDYPAAFTRVSHYKQWILDNISDTEL